MLNFMLRAMHKEVPRLTQADLIGTQGETITQVKGSRPSTLNTIHLSSHEGEFFYNMGKGEIDPREITRVLLHHAMSSTSVQNFQQLIDDFLLYHHAVSTNATIWRNLVAYVTGSNNDRATKPSSMGRMPAEAIRERLVREIAAQGITTNHADLFGTVEGDYAISMLAQIGLVVPGTPLVYRVSRTVPVPNFDIYVDCVRAASFTRVMEGLATADLGSIKSQMSKAVAVSPSFIANELASAAMRASDRVRGTRDARAVANAVFYYLGTVWDVTTPDKLVASESIQNAAGFSALLTNVSMFVAYQRQVAEHGPFTHPGYDDYVVAKEIVPLFVEAVDRISPYKERTLAEAIGHIGVSSISEHDSAKSHMAIFESWNFSRSATAFVPVRNSRNGFGRFLMEEISVSDQLSSALGPIADTFAVEGFVNRHLSAMSTASPGSFNVQANGTSVMLAMPSLSAVPTPLGVTTATLLAALRRTGKFVPDMKVVGVEGDTVSDSEGMGSEQLAAAVARGEALLHSYYVLILAMAVARGGLLSIDAVGTAGNPVAESNIAIRWETTTSSRTPFGPAALMGGRVETYEPLERLAYSADVLPTLTVTPPALPLGDYDRSLHVWNWRESSQPVSYKDSYTTTVANRSLTVHLSEVDILSLGYERDRLRFLIPASARAIAEMWVSWYTSTDAELARLVAQATDSAAIAALEGRQLAAGVLLAQRLRAIGRSPVGQTVCRIINSQLAAQLRGLGQVDAMKGLYVVPHQIRMEVWTGLVLLQMLGVLETTDASNVAASIVASNAMTTVMTMGLDE